MTSRALAVVLEQAKDEALWCKTDSIVEAYFQQELRRLHQAVEEDAGCPECLAEIAGERLTQRVPSNGAQADPKPVVG